MRRVSVLCHDFTTATKVNKMKIAKVMTLAAAYDIEHALANSIFVLILSSWKTRGHSTEMPI